MHETSNHLPDQHPERHEHSDVVMRPLLIFIGTVLVLAVVMHIGLYFLYQLYARSATERSKQSPASAIQSTIDTPEPRLQGIPGFHPNTARQDWLQMKQENEKILSTYGPGDQKGFARIPIDRAMALLVQRGLPTTRPSGGADVSHP